MADFLCPYDAWEPWDAPVVFPIDGPVLTHVTDDDALDDLPRSGPAGFTATLAPSRPVKKPKRKRR